jgi:hypothetical protein
MDWSSIGKTIAKVAPIAAGILTGGASTAVTAVGTLLSSVLGTDPTPDAVETALKADPDALLKVKQMELDNKIQLTKMHLEAETNQLMAINKTMQAEMASNDAYVRRWRPTYGYMIAVSWFIQMSTFTGALAYVFVTAPANLPQVVASLGTVFGALTGLWGIALTVLGVNVSKRSADKQVQAGQEPAAGILAAIASRIQK